MLTKNGEVIVFKNGTSTTEDGKKIIQELRDNTDWDKRYITFKLNRPQIMSQNDRGHMIIEKPGLVSIKPITWYKEGSDDIELRYYKNQGELRENKVNAIFIRNGQITLDREKDLDFIYFLYKNKHHNMLYVHHNTKAEASKLIKEKQASSTLGYYLYNKASKLMNDPDFARKMCSAYGITGSSDKSNSIDELLPLLEAEVMRLEMDDSTDRGVDSFVNDIVASPKELDIRQYIQTAVDLKLIVFDKLKSTYYYSIEETGERIKLLEIFRIDWNKRQEKLVDYFLKNEFEADKLTEFMTGVIDTPKEHIPTKEEIEEADWNDLQRLARAAVIFEKGMKKDETREALMEHYGYIETE